MSRKSPQIHVNPAVLTWARESVGSSIDEAAKRLKLAPSEFLSLESGECVPSLTQLKTLAEYYKRPLAAFLLPEPPAEPPLPWEFRTLRKGRELSRETRLAIRQARNLQTIADDLMDALNDEISLSTGVSIEDDPEEVGRIERSRIGLPMDDQIRWRSSSEAFRQWRLKIEAQNILVFVFSMPMNDGRGFSLTERPYAIVVNGQDAYNGRTFTLLHEYGHLLLSTNSAMDEPDKTQTIETWCDRFAASMLLPEADFRKTVEENINPNEQDIRSETIWGIASHFRVSPQTVLRRMRHFSLVHSETFDALYSAIASSTTAKMPRKAEGGLPPYRKCFYEKGKFFVSLVLEGRSRGILDYAEIAEYLSLNLKHLNAIESLAMG